MAERLFPLGDLRWSVVVVLGFCIMWAALAGASGAENKKPGPIIQAIARDLGEYAGGAAVFVFVMTITWMLFSCLPNVPGQ